MPLSATIGGRPPSSYSVTLISFAFNEEASLDDFLRRAEQLLRSLTTDFELIVVNDGSVDRTGEILGEFARSRPWCRPLNNPTNLGSAASLIRAIPLASKDVVFWQTVDWSYSLDHMVEAFGEIERFDALQGVRPPVWSREGLERRSDNAVKALISTVNYLLVRTLFGLPFGDYQNVTVYRRPLLQSLELEANSAFTNPEMLLKAWWKGARFLVVPVPFVKRRRGKASGTRLRFIVAAIRDILKYWWRWKVCGRRADQGRGQVSHWRPAAK